MNDVQQAIPHRPPFLFVDKIVEVTDDEIVAVKTIEPDAAFFVGHFPGYPVMPGVLLCEAIVQAGAILLSRGAAPAGDHIPVLTRIGGAKFKRMVRPGDRIELRASLVEKVSQAYFMKGKATVDGKLAASVEFVCSLVPKASGR